MPATTEPQTPRTRKAPAAKKPAAAPSARPRRKKEPSPPRARGLDARELAAAQPPPEVAELCRRIEADGGSVLGAYREPIGGTWAVLAGLPLDKVVPTPFQRDLSEGHVTRLREVIDRIDRYLDPIIAVRTAEGVYWTPNGNHRRGALERLGARSIVALVLPDERIAYRILALNTEKAHNVREKALEVIRMARSLAEIDPSQPEGAYALEFEEPPLLTLGLCYEARPRFSGGAYHSILRHVERFMDDPLPEALEARKRRAALLLQLDDAVTRAVQALKEHGLESPYLKAFVVARVNPLRFHRGEPPPAEALLEKMLASAQRFDPSAIRPDHVARASGPPPEE
ncbi:MAG: ParB N-terminal domain-containing protein [Polyangiaceae bacterium]|nr:ParB N-terminal domain-containing protein [Polyangiaceae bacterium]